MKSETVTRQRLRLHLGVAIPLMALVGCGTRPQQQPTTETTSGGGQTSGAQARTEAGCRLEYRSKVVQALTLPTNVLVSAPNQASNSGPCTLVLSGQDLVFPVSSESGNAEYTLLLKALELRRQSRIITNGYRVTIVASTIFSENGQIVAFDAPRKARDGLGPGQNGENGLSAGNLEIVAETLTVQGALSVDLRGQDGGDGIPGIAGALGQRGAPGTPGISGVFGCQQGGGNGGPGGDGGRGSRGGNGGKGGNGGNLVMKIKRSPPGGLSSSLDGGIGGRPAAGGTGGPGGPGGEGGSGNGFCGGGQPGPSGRPGAAGDPGQEGVRGVSGQRL